MGAKSATGIGLGSADTHNKGSVHNTLGINRIVDLPRYPILYTAYLPDGNWNVISFTGASGFSSGNLDSFYLAFQFGPTYIREIGRVRSDAITEETVISIHDPDNAIFSVTFADVTDISHAPFTYRRIIVTALPFEGSNPKEAIVSWSWNSSLLFCKVSIFPPL